MYINILVLKDNLTDSLLQILNKITEISGISVHCLRKLVVESSEVGTDEYSKHQVIWFNHSSFALKKTDLHQRFVKARVNQSIYIIHILYNLVLK